MAARYSNFHYGTITNNPLAVAGASVTSAEFADLPTIVAPDYLWIVLDPLGTVSDPEIVKVTAHSAASTTATVERAQQTSLNGGPARQHDEGTQWRLSWTADDAIHSSNAGAVTWAIWATAPTGWLKLDGTTVTNVQTTYPDLWAVVPASWKSGTSLVLPQISGRTILGGGTLGATGGANTHTLLTADLPAHMHTIAHTHEHPHTHSIAHTHDIDHNHASFATASAGAHLHDGHFINTHVPASGTDLPVFVASTASSYSGSANLQAGGGADGEHAHTIDMPVSSGLASGASSAGSSGVASEAATGASSVASSGSTGSGSTIDHTPAHLRLNAFIHT